MIVMVEIAGLKTTIASSIYIRLTDYESARHILANRFDGTNENRTSFRRLCF